MTSTDIARIKRLMSLATGDEKHGSSSLSTLDVIWVLYDRILRFDPKIPGGKTGTASYSVRGMAASLITQFSRIKASFQPLRSRHLCNTIAFWERTQIVTWCPE